MSPKNRHDNRRECVPDCYIPLHVVGTGLKFEAFYTRLITQGTRLGDPAETRGWDRGSPGSSLPNRSLARFRARSIRSVHCRAFAARSKFLYKLVSVHCRAFAARSKFLYKLLSVHCRCFPTQIPNVRKDNLNYVLFPNFGKFWAVREVVRSTFLCWWTLQMEKRQQWRLLERF
jgi:hypothetical protein